ncbi:MAG: hypothetical protein LBP59_16270 [Planctomycetaceae bacterium]|jgi:multidrug efflux pump subunit AcrB|nr:hypothetical protein [Planctomycetaceae bacterium]
MSTELPLPENQQQQQQQQQQAPEHEPKQHEKTKPATSLISRLIRLKNRIIIILILLLLILIYLLFKFGLGGGGSFLPGGKGIVSNGDADNTGKITSKVTETHDAKIETKIIEPEVKRVDDNLKQNNENENKSNTINIIKQPVKYEIIISFEPDPKNAEIAKNFACNIETIDTSKIKDNQVNKKTVACNNMSDFENEIEKTIREWRLAMDLIDVNSTNFILPVEPVLCVLMAPFPGEGVYQKIESITKSIDKKIKIMKSYN